MTFARFIREVQKFAPNELLPALALEGTAQTIRHREDPKKLLDGASAVTPWAIMEIARESIVHGVQGGQRPPSSQDMRRLCEMYLDLNDPLTESPAASLDRYLVRVGFEQFRWQLSEFEELARPHALFIEAASRVPEATVFQEESWRSALGCSVDEFVDIGFFLFVWASGHGGWIDLNWLSLPHFRPVLDRYPRERIEWVVENRLAGSLQQIRDMDGKQHTRTSVAEHRFNPLAARPLIRMRDGRLLAPHPLLILHRVGTTGIYYDRVGEKGFTDQLGKVFEEYVGMHLRLLSRAEVHQSVMAARSDEVIDYVVVLPDVVLLIEVKATRLTEHARAGLDQLDIDRERTIGKAYSQINRAARLIDERHPAFSFVPQDRPLRGLVVTLEPYWNATSGFSPPRASAVPTTVASIREVEYLGSVGILNDVGPQLLHLTGDHSNYALHQAVEHLGQAKNPILERGWDAAFEHAA